MNLQKKINLKNMEKNDEIVEREAVEILVDENLNGKLDNYLKQFQSDDIEGILNLSIEKNKKELFNGVLQITIDGKSYRYEREDYKKLADLTNHLFDKFKEELAKK